MKMIFTVMITNVLPVFFPNYSVVYQTGVKAQYHADLGVPSPPA